MEINYGGKPEDKFEVDKDYHKNKKKIQANMKKNTPNVMSEEMFFHSFVKG